MQTDKNFEHIVIDGGSTDHTIEILKSYAGKYNLRWSSEPDEGIADAFNKGVNASKGKWLLFLGSGDELYDVTVLSDFHDILQTKSMEYIVWGDVVLKQENGKVMSTITGRHSKYRLLQYMCYHHQGIFHNKELFKKYGKFDSTIQIAMDYDVILRAFKDIKSSGYVKKKISYFLTGGNSQLNYYNTIVDFYRVQIRNKILPDFILYGIFIWSRLKYYLRTEILKG